MNSLDDGDVIYGLLRLAGMDLALPLSALREVVPCPEELSGLPAVAPGLLGAMELRRLVLPVLDLRPVLGRPEERWRGQVVVVVAHGGQVLGLLADEVRGVCEVPADALIEARAEGGGLLFSHTFRHPETGQPFAVLDAAAVLGQQGVPSVTDVTRDAGALATGSAAGSSRRTLTVLRCGGYRLAIEAAHVHTTLPTPAVRPSVLSGGMCTGVVEYAEREVPVVDPLVLLGLGELPSDDVDAGLVLDLGQGYVVLALSALLDLAEVPGEDVLPLPGFALPRPDLLAGMAEIDGVGECLVLDGAALRVDAQLAGFASVNTALEASAAGSLLAAGAPAGASAAASAGGAPAYLTYSVGVDVATRLDQVVEILPFPSAVTPTTQHGLLGMVVHRRVAVPVLCLATLLGRPSAPVGPSSCLLLVSVGEELAAFAVDALHAIDPLTWSDEEQAVRGGPQERGLSLRSAPLVRVGDDARLLPELDLQGLARRIRTERSTADGASPRPALVGR